MTRPSRRKRILTRLTQEEYRRVKQLCRARKMNPSELVRDVLLKEWARS